MTAQADHIVHGSRSPRSERVPRRTWVGLLAVLMVVLFAGLLGNTLGETVPDDDAAAQFALSHFIPLPIEILLLVLFVRYSGWGRDVWAETPTLALRPRRWWLIVFPVLALVLPLAQLGDVPWGSRSFGFAALIALGTLMVGITEEAAFRGVLLTAVRGRHGELVALLVTSVLFALAHIPSSLIHGVPLAAILIQVAAITATGSVLYWVRRVTGQLWIAIVIHALTDWVLYLESGAGDPTAALTGTDSTGSGSPVVVTAQLLLWAAGIAGVISAGREDHRRRVTAK